MRRFVLVLGALLATGCNFEAEVSEYCTETQSCTQAANGEFCVMSGHPCQEGQCCEGLVCTSSGTCASGATLSVSPTSLDFGHLLRTSSNVLRQPVVVTNTGSVPTGTLRLEFATGTSPLLSIEPGDCAGRVLAPGAQCTMQVTFAPRQGGKVEAELRIQHDLPSAVMRVPVLGIVGVPLSVETEDVRMMNWSVDQAGVVSSEPKRLFCRREYYTLLESCTAYFALDEQVTLRAGGPQGLGFVEWSGACQGAASECTLSLTDATQVRARFAPWLNVSVEAIDGALGAVKVPSSSDWCRGTCAYYASGQVTLTASISSYHSFVGWGGDCAAAGEAETCTLDVQGFRQVVAHYAPLNRVVLAKLPTAELGADLSGADAECQRVGNRLDRPDGQFRAWLSTPTQSAASRLGGARGWANLDGEAFADTVESLAAGRLFRALTKYSGYSYRGEPIATGTTPEGLGSAATCGGWTEQGAAPTAGNAHATTGSWTQDLLAPGPTCGDSVSFYCFGTRYRSPARVARATRLRIAFLSSPWTPAGGVDAADAHCQQDAADAGLTGRFQALLAPAGMRPRDRLNLGYSGCARVDGVALDYCHYPGAVPINVTAQGDYVGSSGDVASARFVWTGGQGRAEGTTTAADTCNSWTGGAGATGKVGRPEFIEPQAAEVSGLASSRVSCSSPQRVVCVEGPRPP